MSLLSLRVSAALGQCLVAGPASVLAVALDIQSELREPWAASNHKARCEAHVEGLLLVLVVGTLKDASKYFILLL